MFSAQNQILYLIDYICMIAEIESPAVMFSDDLDGSKTMALYDPDEDCLQLAQSYPIKTIEGFLLMAFCVADILWNIHNYEKWLDSVSEEQITHEMLGNYYASLDKADGKTFALALLDCLFDDWDMFGKHEKVIANTKIRNQYLKHKVRLKSVIEDIETINF